MALMQCLIIFFFHMLFFFFPVFSWGFSCILEDSPLAKGSLPGCGEPDLIQVKGSE